MTKEEQYSQFVKTVNSRRPLGFIKLRGEWDMFLPEYFPFLVSSELQKNIGKWAGTVIALEEKMYRCIVSYQYLMNEYGFVTGESMKMEKEVKELRTKIREQFDRFTDYIYSYCDTEKKVMLRDDTTLTFMLLVIIRMARPIWMAEDSENFDFSVNDICIGALIVLTRCGSINAPFVLGIARTENRNYLGPVFHDFFLDEDRKEDFRLAKERGNCLVEPYLHMLSHMSVEQGSNQEPCYHVRVHDMLAEFQAHKNDALIYLEMCRRLSYCYEEMGDTREANKYLEYCLGMENPRYSEAIKKEYARRAEERSLEEQRNDRISKITLILVAVIFGGLFAIFAIPALWKFFCSHIFLCAGILFILYIVCSAIWPGDNRGSGSGMNDGFVDGYLFRDFLDD